MVKAPIREKFTKAWKVTGRDTKGRMIQLSRPYHSKSAADKFSKLAESAGYTDVQVRAIEGYERK